MEEKRRRKRVGGDREEGRGMKGKNRMPGRKERMRRRVGEEERGRRKRED